jgi:CheY-like chemotaxis protein
MARVLLIDDDDMLREVQAELLHAAGHQTLQAATGLAGIEAIRSTRPDLVLCDVEMPGLDGFAVLEAVRADPQLASTPFLFLLHAGMELQRLASADSPGRALLGAAEAGLVRDAACAQAREHGREQDIEMDLADATLPVAEAYVRKIVAELVDNALKFSEAGKPVKVLLTAAGQKVTLTVADAGRGMTLDQIRDVGAFSQFNRAVFEQQGSGLGLILSSESSKHREAFSTSGALRAKARP